MTSRIIKVFLTIFIFQTSLCGGNITLKYKGSLITSIDLYSENLFPDNKSINRAFLKENYISGLLGSDFKVKEDNDFEAKGFDVKLSNIFFIRQVLTPFVDENLSSSILRRVNDAGNVSKNIGDKETAGVEISEEDLKTFIDKEKKGHHLSLLSVLFLCKSDEKLYVYLYDSPNLYLSGEKKSEDNIDCGKNQTFIRKNSAKGYSSEIALKKLISLLKNIESFTFQSTSPQAFNHSEVAILLSIIFDRECSIEKLHSSLISNKKYEVLDMLVLIKNKLPICSNCQKCFTIGRDFYCDKESYIFAKLEDVEPKSEDDGESKKNKKPKINEGDTFYYDEMLGSEKHLGDKYGAFNNILNLLPIKGLPVSVFSNEEIASRMSFITGVVDERCLQKVKKSPKKENDTI